MRMPRSIAFLLPLIASVTLSVPALAQCEMSNESLSEKGEKPSIVATAASVKDFSTLVAAVQAAGLVEALEGDGPFTVFAPTNAAFDRLPEGTVATLLKPENKARLAEILKYHVVAGKVLAKDVVGLTAAETLSGQRVDISTAEGTVSIDGARVTKTDILCSNGVIHVIDAVILPSEKNIVETAAAAGSFTTLIAAAKAAGLVPALTGEGPITVFAPTDEAFSKLPKGTVESLLLPENRGQLANILKLHVVSGRVYSPAAVELGQAKTLSGESITIRQKKGDVLINSSKVVAADLDCSNGVIHVIDTVLLPK